jgi:hypothetical protein
MKDFEFWFKLACWLFHRRRHRVKVCDYVVNTMMDEDVEVTSYLCMKCGRLWKEYR